MLLFYNLFIRLFKIAVFVVSFFNKKARIWLEGRKNWRYQLAADFKNNTADVVWVHCASLGEFEQGKPVIEKLKNQFPQKKILLSFFSPSGYEIRKNYKNADWVYYLPLDTASNAKFFIDTCKPKLCIIIKYEYWYHFLHQLYNSNIPVFLVSAIFRKNSIFFKFYGSLHRKMLGFFSILFVQNEASKILLKDIIDIKKIVVAGDTRFDTVANNAQNFEAMDIIENFIGNSQNVLVAGSTWAEDEILLSKFSIKNPDYKIIIAPHEIDDSHIHQIQNLFSNSVLYSCAETNINQQNVLIINTIGILSRIYKYATISYIGGGFNKSGIHNTLEAAVFNKPIITGPNIKKFNEAVVMEQLGGLMAINNEKQLLNAIQKFHENYSKNKISNLQYINKNMGASEIVLKYINLTCQ